MWNFYLEGVSENIDIHGLTIEEARTQYVEAVNRYCGAEKFREFGDDDGTWKEEHFEGIDNNGIHFRGGFCPEE